MAESLTGFTVALADRYRIERELGRGGMATVYLAHDLKHDRGVALKVLHPELAATLGPERFLREIRTAARLQHPHILPLHDSGEAAGFLWYAMPYVEGESLRARLTRETQLPLEDALHVARDVAGALAYAHQHGVIHRDIKPENILLEAGEAVVADFGIARAIDSAGGAKLTETGLALGTPAYMSPEQAMGGEVDGRSDVYALGCVLYEMLAGEPPHTGPTAQAIITRRLTQTPRPLRTMRELVPEAVEQAVVTALAKSPADRFQTVAEFARALATPSISVPAPAVPTVRQRLRWPSARLAVIGAAVLGLLALGGLVARSLRLGSHAASPKMLAVLPFENLGRSEDEYFADGLTEEITSRLAGLRALGVISRTSSMQYKRTTKPLKQVGRELGVGYVLEGSVRWEKLPDGKSRVRVTPQLIEVSDDRHMWASRYDADLADIFQVQGQIAEQVTNALDLALLAPERKVLAAKPTESLEAYDAFLRANELFYNEAGDLPTFRRAAEQYDRAVALDSAFAPAWAGVSRAYSVLYNYSSVGREADRRRAYTAAERALRLDPALVDGHLALVRYYGYTRYDWPRALEEYTKARERAPHSPEVVKIGAVAEARSGRFEQAIEHTRDAERLDPRSYALPTNRAAYLLVLRRYPEALAAADRAIALGPNAADIYQIKAQIYLAEGDLARARTVLESAAGHVDPAALVAWVATATDLFWALDDAQQKLLLRLTPRSFDDDTVAWGLALAGTYSLVGDRARALAYADSARTTAETLVRAAPDNALLHAYLGLAYAYLGQAPDAIREGRAAVGRLPLAMDAFQGPYTQHQLARIYILIGKYDDALDQLEPLLKIPYWLSPAWLRLDPTFAPLRNNARFKRLVAGAA